MPAYISTLKILYSLQQALFSDNKEFIKWIVWPSLYFNNIQGISHLARYKVVKDPSDEVQFKFEVNWEIVI